MKFNVHKNTIANNYILVNKLLLYFVRKRKVKNLRPLIDLCP